MSLIEVQVTQDLGDMVTLVAELVHSEEIQVDVQVEEEPDIVIEMEQED